MFLVAIHTVHEVWLAFHVYGVDDSVPFLFRMFLVVNLESSWQHLVGIIRPVAVSAYTLPTRELVSGRDWEEHRHHPSLGSVDVPLTKSRREFFYVLMGIF